MTSNPPSPEPPQFTFEVAAHMSESDYVRWHSLRSARPGRAKVYRWGLTLLAALCFASWYTVTLGIVLGLVALAVWTESRWMAWSSRSSYRLATYLHTPLIYGVSSEALWFRGARYEPSLRGADLLYGEFETSSSGFRQPACHN